MVLLPFPDILLTDENPQTQSDTSAQESFKLHLRHYIGRRLKNSAYVDIVASKCLTPVAKDYKHSLHSAKLEAYKY